MNRANATTSLPRGATDYLKGVAIAAVIVNHYAILYFFSPHTWANSFISFFFLLSGAGIYLSFERDTGGRLPVRAVLKRYAWRRAVRIYPVYWFAYALFLLLLFAFDLFVGSFTAWNLVTAIAGAPTYPRGIFWFVTAILQCYIFAPLLYAAIRDREPREAFGTAIMLLGASLLASVLLLDRIGNDTLRDMLAYRHLALGNVVLFCFGMLIPRLAVVLRGVARRAATLAASALVFFLMVYVTDSPDRLFPASELYLAPLLYLSAFAFCLAFVASAPPLPLGGLVGRAGIYSYPLFLLHQSFFILLFEAGLVGFESVAGVAWTVLLFPLFFLFCAGVQRLLSPAAGRPAT